MKRFYSFLLFCSVCFIFSSTEARPWQPFRLGRTYFYEQAVLSGPPGLTELQGLRLDSTAVGSVGDTTFFFNTTTRRALTNTTPPCWVAPHTLYQLSRQNLFGQSLRRSSTGAYEFSANGRILTIPTKAAVGQALPFLTNSSLTITLLSKGVAQVFGRTDSVLIYQVSDGRQLHLSRSFGLYSAPNLLAYLVQTPVSSQQLTLLSVPELQVGETMLTDARQLLSWQVGDVLGYAYLQGRPGFPPCSEDDRRWQVRARRFSLNGDTLLFALEVQTQHRDYSAPTNPFCPGSGPTTSLLPIEQRTVWATRTSLNLAGAEVPLLLLPGQTQGSYLVLPPTRTSPTQPYASRTLAQTLRCTRAGQRYLIDDEDNQVRLTYVAGVGLQSEVRLGFIVTRTTTLTCYTHTGSPLPSCLPLATRHKQPLVTTSVFPNPVAQELTLHFEAPRAQQATVSLYDAMGRLVWQHTGPAKAGTTEMSVPTTSLPSGVYVLRLMREGRTEVLQVVKTY